MQPIRAAYAAAMGARRRSIEALAANLAPLSARDYRAT